MNEVVNGLVPSALSRPYRYVKLEWNADFAMLTVRMGVRPIQCYSLAAMAELQQVFNDITAHPGLVRHFVMASDVPGVFNFGGDLSLFVLLALVLIGIGIGVAIVYYYNDLVDLFSQG